MKNILFLAINSKFVHTNLALRYIKKYIEINSFYKINLIEKTINNHLLEILTTINEENPDLIAISTYIWNSEYVYKLIIEIKKILPNTKILLGGPEVSYQAEKLMNLYKEIDYIISGEGEEIFLEFLTKDIDSVKGIYYRKEKKITFNGYKTPILNLDIIPFPYDENELSETSPLILYYESSRGCPFNCAYCMSSLDKKVRYFSLERVKTDLMKFINKKVKLVKFVDRTFNLNKKRYLEIWKFLLENYNEKTTFHFEISVDLFDEEVIKFLQKVPRKYFQFEIGIQTINEKTLNIIHRTNKLEILKKNILDIKDNIHLHVDLIAGLPEEDYNTFKKSFNYVHSLKAEMIQLGFLKILNGTEMESLVSKYNYNYLDFPPYEVLSNNYISFNDLVKLKNIEKALDFYYNSNKFLKSLNYILINFYDSPFEFYENISEYYKKRKLINVAHKQVSIFNYLYEFYLDKSFKNIDIFIEYLKFDYLSIGKTGYFPYWFKRNTDKEKYNELLNNLNFKSKREAYKKTEYEIFNYDIINNKKEKKEILFIYNNDLIIKEI
ncbi:radical SAM superfamily enzyme YgiQ (UPF0313 family) [Hypnocyclicus thermotrophus]|uniref:Radical SAM superfamily enzyme YgiQ (UPF0313 family) n=1 Tax=Hypnocyclicus thermotrophus TaxID=1627895 RepID=A0AA46DXW9_9FUSO|nr:B12-binding domain-containing radical SAM protein [Hypnocyclicus thermotrophus]TDT68638.1 radical SAM superfamily enzyme YgiQ (UPF0313 family) [Hypnocyclicus thermotrophus]